MILKKGYTDTEYADFAILANEKRMSLEIQENGDVHMVESKKPNYTTEEISALREQAYIKEVDVLHAQKSRKTILGTWTEEDEANYIAEVKARSEDIANRYPYSEEE